MTSPGAYSAGTAYLDIIPSFRGVQQAIQRQLRDMESALGKDAGEKFGKEFEKSAVRQIDKALDTTAGKAGDSGKDAAEKYAGRFADEFKKSMLRVQREMKAMNLSVQPIGFDKLRKDIEALSKVKIGKGIDAGPALIEIGRIEKKLREIQDKATNLEFRSNLGTVASEFEAFRKRVEKEAHFEVEIDINADRQLGLFERSLKRRIDAALSNIAPIDINANTNGAQDQLMDLRRRLFELGDKRIGVDLGGSDALAEMESIRAALDRLATDKTLDVNVRVDAASAVAELVKIRLLSEMVDKQDVDIDVDVDTGAAVGKLAGMRLALAALHEDQQSTANSFRAFSPIVLGVAFGIAALAPLASAAGIAIGLMGTAAIGAAAGLGVLFFGFSGIADAVKALGKEQQNAAKDAEAQAKAIRTAESSVADASRALSRARTGVARAARDGARDVAAAVDRQRDAEQDLVDAQRDVVRAQQEVNDAREDAAERLQELQFRIRGGALAERQGVLDLREARAEYEASLKDPTKTAAEREQLLISYQREQLSLDQIRDDNRDMAAEQAESRRKGIEGSDEVVAAQGRVREAQERAGDAAERVRDAEQAVADARVQAAERVADAQGSVTAAQQNLADAQEKLFEAQGKVSESAQAAAIAMAALGPAGQEFAIFINGLRDDMRGLRDLVQEGMLPGVQSMIEMVLERNGPLLRDFLSTMGTTIGDLFVRFGELMTSPQWQQIWATVTKYAPIFFTQFAETGMALFTAMGNIFVALAPSAERFGDAIVNGAQAFERWTASWKDSETLQAAMAWFFENGPIIWDTIKDIGIAFINILVALEPLGMVILGIIDGFAEWIGGMDPQVLGSIITAIIGLVIAFQLGVGAVAAFWSIVALAVNPISAAIFIIGALVTGLIILYTQSETARAIIDSVFQAIGAVISWLWNNIVTPVFGAIGSAWDYLVESFSGGGTWLGGVVRTIADVFVWLWDNILQPIFSVWQVVWGVLWKFIQGVWDRIGRPIFETFVDIVTMVWNVVGPIFELIGLAFKGLFALIGWVWDHGGKQVFGAIIDIVKFLWKNVIGPILGFILDRWEMIWSAIELVWTSVGKPVFDFVSRVIKSLVEIFRGNFDKLKYIWDGFWETIKIAAAKPINFVIHFVLNKGLFAAFNWIIDKLGLDKDWKITPWKQVGPKAAQYAAGGRVTGWSPHDKADNIPAMLTANEYVQPVDTTRHYGVDIMDAIRKKRIPRELLAQFADGGLVGAQRLATGGTVDAMWGWVKQRHPYARLTSAYRPGDPGYHGRRQAIDIAGQVPWPSPLGRAQMLAINKDIAANFPNATELIHTAPGAVNLWHGGRHTYNAATQIAHMNHNHWAMAMLSMMKGAAGGAGSKGIDWLSLAFGDLAAQGIRNAGDVFSKLKGGLSKLSELGTVTGGNLLKILKGAGGKALDWMWGKISGPVKAFWEGITSTGDEGVIAAGSSAVRRLVQGAASMPEFGWGEGAQWDALSRLITGESSWNPRAQNPTSSASGLFQFIDGTWANYRPLGSNARRAADASIADQTRAGLNYIRDVYGTPLNAYRMWSSRAPHWYSEGGEVTPGVSSTSASEGAPTLYDTGGWLPPGLHTVLNASNRPEPILTSGQWDELVAARRTGGAGSGGIEQLHLHEVQYDPAESIALLDHAVRVARHGSRYSMVGED